MASYSERREKEIADLKAAIERISAVLWRPRQTLPQARREIALILKELKQGD